MHNVPKDEVIIVGHKNPDTDSVCSAIAYANLKNQTENKYIPKRAGKINKETEFVLKYFNVPVPELIVDANTQVRDIAYRLVEGVDENVTLKEAWEYMQKNDATTLPVLKNNHVKGIITVGDIARSYMSNAESNILHISQTSYGNIAKTIGGELILGDSNMLVPKGKLLIGAAHVDIMEQYINKGDIVILSDREKPQLVAIEKGAAMLVVCLVDEVSEKVLEEAKEKGTAIIRCDADTYTTALLIGQSVPVKSFMIKDNILSFYEDDNIETLKSTMSKTRVRYFPVTDVMGEYKGLLSRRNYLDARKKQIILVDHNERTQSVDNIDKAEILEIIDHHRLGNLETVEPVYFRNQPLGCTATIIYQMFREKNLIPEASIAGIMCGAIVSDTLMFKSPTCTQMDEMTARELALIAGININEFALKMFTEGSNLAGKSMHEILHQDFKKFIIGDKTVGIGQINCLNVDETEKIKASMTEYLLNRNRTDSDIIIFVLTHILEDGSDIIGVGDGACNLLSAAFNKDFSKHSCFLPGVVSRKKQIVPALINAMQEQ